jgi:hypothetical protein
MIDGTHPRARTIGAIVEDPGYHARLLDYVRRYRRDPASAAAGAPGADAARGSALRGRRAHLRDAAGLRRVLHEAAGAAAGAGASPAGLREFPMELAGP